MCCSETVDDDADTVIGSDGPRRTRSRVCGVPILASTDTGTTKVLVSDGTRSGTWKAHQETARPLPWYPADFEVAIGNLTRPLLMRGREVSFDQVSMTVVSRHPLFVFETVTYPLYRCPSPRRYIPPSAGRGARAWLGTPTDWRQTVYRVPLDPE